jgi:hypothetical protein
MMKMYARTNEKSYLNNYQGEDWQVVTTIYHRYPSGLRECVRFADGYVCKVDRCDVCYVFDK